MQQELEIPYSDTNDEKRENSKYKLHVNQWKKRKRPIDRRNAEQEEMRLGKKDLKKGIK